MRPPAFLYGLYERRLTRALQGAQLPHHVGLMLDGNRRWARSAGLATAQGHQAGADRIADLLGWCEDVGIERVTLWMLSTDNLRRDEREVADLLEIIAATVAKLATTRRWRLQLVGELDLLPAEIADRLRAAEELTSDVAGLHLNIAVGYGGRHEIAGAVRSLIAEYVDAGALNATLEADQYAVSGRLDTRVYIEEGGTEDPEELRKWALQLLELADRWTEIAREAGE